VISAVHVGYVHALNTVLLIGALVAAVATIVTFLTIRTQDFHHVRQATGAAGPDETTPAASDAQAYS